MPNLKGPSDYMYIRYLADKKDFLNCRSLPYIRRMVWCLSTRIVASDKFEIDVSLISVKRINMGKLFGQGTSLKWELIVPIYPLECFQVWEAISQVV